MLSFPFSRFMDEAGVLGAVLTLLVAAIDGDENRLAELDEDMAV